MSKPAKKPKLLNFTEPRRRKLPDSRTCIDCVHFSRCQWLFNCKTYSTECDFLPVRFRLAVVSR